MPVQADARLRGISTTPIILVLVVAAVAAAVILAQWYAAQGRAAGLEADAAAKVAAVRAQCLAAVSSGQAVMVNSTAYANYTGPGCYANSSVVIVVLPAGGT
jgi:flagellar basal body-associated protein FliL